MAPGFRFFVRSSGSLCLCLLSSAGGYAAPFQAPDPSQIMAAAGLEYGSANIEVRIKEPDGTPVKSVATVTLLRLTGQPYNQATADKGRVVFQRVPASEFKVQVVAPGYEAAEKHIELQNHIQTAVVDISLKPLSVEDAAASRGLYALPQRVQKDVGKALDALRANRPNDALRPLQAAQKNAPNSAEIEYLLSLYSSQTKDEAQARAHLTKTLELNPKHLGALLAMSNNLLQERKGAEAAPYASRAAAVEPASWRAHVLLAEALLLQQNSVDAAKEAQRALDLGHERAASAQLVLAHALVQGGDRDRALRVLQEYLKTHPSDAGAAKDLETLKNPAVSATSLSVDSAADDLNAAAAAAALPVASNWRPADVDDRVPPVEMDSSCAVEDVVRKAGIRLTDLVTDVDKFAATESLVHESINKWGVISAPEKRQFDYVVSIQELQHKYLNVEEYRNGAHGAPADFPEGVGTYGLPALVLIFHPYNAPDFDMGCEGLARLSTGLAWQVHFKQRPDKPNVIKRYRVGADGPSYPVALKGRVWIAADTYQIVRLESDIVSPIPDIKLLADHAEIEYGPVQFQGGKVNMWLPQTADIYYDWRGHRIHRRHSFSHYMLFGVEERQKISVPKVDDSKADSGSSSPNEKPNK
jgi:Flp pilus assembly protein TadD